MTTITNEFTTTNAPNAAKLVKALRSTGYGNYEAIADLVDNSLDADAANVWINIETKGGESVLRIADDGEGMDKETLDEALKLGSLTEKDETADLGKYGMGLSTASMSICKLTEVYTKQDRGALLYSAQDIDVITKENQFVKVLKDAGHMEKAVFDKFVTSPHGTLVVLQKADRLSNKNLSVFAGTLGKELGRIFRHFIFAGKKIWINGKEIEATDPLMQSVDGTKSWSDDEYEIKIPGRELKEKIRIKISLLPDLSRERSKDLGINIANQGFYVLRNNREIAAAKTLGVFAKHNDYNRFRAEIYFPAEIDDEMGLNFSKHEVKPIQSILDTIKGATMGQLTSIKRLAAQEKASHESEQVDHTDAEKVIAQKSKLLTMPKAVIEKRKSHTSGGKPASKSTDTKERANFTKTYTSPSGAGAKFLHVSLGEAASVFEAYQEGKFIVVQWNTDHPFYKRMMLETRDKNVINATDYLAFAISAAELNVLDEDSTELVTSIRSIMSSNLRTLLS